MGEPEPLVRDISDTARWAAFHRAVETERPDAVFRDPLARRLAGSRGEAMHNALETGNRPDWPWVVRTHLYDQFIADQIAQGADMVVNVAAGLDARPYRMELPATLHWIEIDLPGILDYKEDILRDQTPRCVLERTAPRSGRRVRAPRSVRTARPPSEEGRGPHRGPAHLPHGRPGRRARAILPAQTASGAGSSILPRPVSSRCSIATSSNPSARRARSYSSGPRRVPSSSTLTVGNLPTCVPCSKLLRNSNACPSGWCSWPCCRPPTAVRAAARGVRSVFLRGHEEESRKCS